MSSADHKVSPNIITCWGYNWFLRFRAGRPSKYNKAAVGGEDVTTKRQRDNDEHKQLLIVLNGLEDNKLAVKKREMVLADVITVGSVKIRKIGFRERGR